MSALTAEQAGITPGSKKDQLMQLLKAGCKPGEAALAVGCDPSYVSQLLDDSDFANELVQWKVQKYRGAQERDGKYDSLEDKAISALEMKLDSQGFMMKTETLLRTIQTLNGAKRRSQVSAADVAPIQNVINLTLPQILVQKYQVNSSNEIMSAGSQELVTMPAAAILEQVQARKVKNSETVVEILESAAPTSVARLSNELTVSDSIDTIDTRRARDNRFSNGRNQRGESDLGRRVEEATISTATI